MSTVSVAFTPLPAHVRTARFIAASVARRAGVPEGLLDEIRLAVSEACSLAVRVHAARAPGVAVELLLDEHDDRFVIRVVDGVPRPAPEGGSEAGLADGNASMFAAFPEPAGERSVGDDARGPLGSDDDLLANERIGLAVISGLVDDLQIDYLDGGSVITMRWPLSDSGETERESTGETAEAGPGQTGGAGTDATPRRGGGAGGSVITSR